MSKRSRELGALLLVIAGTLSAGFGCGQVDDSGRAGSETSAGASAAAGIGSGGRAATGTSGGNGQGGAVVGNGNGGVSHTRGGAGGAPPDNVGQGDAGLGGEGGAISHADCDPSLVKQGGYQVFTAPDLEALRGYTRVEGDLVIAGTVANFAPLGCLTEVTGSLTLRSLTIASLEGLSGLQSVGRLDIEQCGALSSLAGLEGLEQVDSLWLFDNPVLADIEALANVALQDDISIVGNPNLTTLVGLRGTRAVRAVWVGGTSLVNLHGLQQLERADLERVDEISDTLSITKNPILADLHGLDTVKGAERLTIADNLALPTCQAERLRDRISAGSSIAFVEISNNDDAGMCP